MKKIKRIVNIMAIVAGITGMLTGCSLFKGENRHEGYQKGTDMSGSCGDNLTYEYKAKTGELKIKGTGEMISCPWSGYGGVPVRSVVFEEGITSIYNGAFYTQSELTGDIVLPSTVTYIDDFAFYGTKNLHSVTIPEGVTYLGSYAFQYSCIEGELCIPDSVTEIGEYCFEGCENLTGTLKLPSSLKKIGRVAFGSCTGFTGDLVIPDSVVEIGDYAFKECKGFNGNLIISKKLTEIPENCFTYCENFTGDLIIPENVKRIGEKAFVKCGFDGNLILPKEMEEIGDGAFDSCENLQGKVIIPTGISRINQDTFYSCGKLTKVTFPEGIKYICHSAFRGCKNLKGELVLPKGLVGIGKCAFIDCSSLTGNLKFPDSLEVIEEGAFNGCSGLTGELNLPVKISSIGENAFHGCNGFSGELILPDSLVFIGKGAFEDCTGINKVTAGSDSMLATIGSGAFRNCASLEEADFTKLSTIPDYYDKDDDEHFVSFPETCSLEVNPDAEAINKIWTEKQNTLKEKMKSDNQDNNPSSMSEEPYYWTSGLYYTFFYGTGVNADSVLYFEEDNVILSINDREYGSYTYQADANGSDTSIKTGEIAFKDGFISELVYLNGYKINMVKVVMTHESGTTEDIYFCNPSGFGDVDTNLRISIEENLISAFEY